MAKIEGMTEGLIAANLELGAVGVVTDVMDSINQEVFATRSKLTSNNLPDTVSDPVPCTWEDDFLNKMENGTTTLASVPPTNAMKIPHSHSPPPPSSPWHPHHPPSVMKWVPK
ncbi:hypothetical protein EDC04DRAFT_2600290 [Pisolithus marmoratus]|nr:hypothetical protein EDC04DRAFT_2600290 [Pisolithus marmoratus]